MAAFRVVAATFVIATAICASDKLSNDGPPARETAADPDKQPEVLTRGPVHEAFAELVTLEPRPNAVSPKAPPEAVEELPPEVKPESQDAVWIAGYWSWDDDLQDFIWVSGIWRIPPPDTRWVPGYWVRVENGYQWIVGFWQSSESSPVDQDEYLRPPPESLEQGPSSPRPSDDHLWVSGCWIWRDSRYLWRPGYWLAAHTDWIWTPSRYVWAPRGCVFVPGHWDYPLSRRGLLFAPVYFAPTVFRGRHMHYSPSIVIDAGALTVHLFGRPSCHQYYFGDYYSPLYAQLGILPWHARFHHGHDPIYAHAKWLHGSKDPGWSDRVRREFEDRRKDEHLRPPRKFAEQANPAQQPEKQPSVGSPLGRPVAEIASGGTDSPIRLEQLDRQRREEILQAVKDQEPLQLRRAEPEATASAAEPDKPQPTAMEPLQAAAAHEPATPSQQDQDPVASPNNDGSPAGPAPQVDVSSDAQPAHTTAVPAPVLDSPLAAPPTPSLDLPPTVDAPEVPGLPPTESPEQSPSPSPDSDLKPLQPEPDPAAGVQPMSVPAPPQPEAEPARAEPAAPRLEIGSHEAIAPSQRDPVSQPAQTPLQIEPAPEDDYRHSRATVPPELGSTRPQRESRPRFDPRSSPRSVKSSPEPSQRPSPPAPQIAEAPASSEHSPAPEISPAQRAAEPPPAPTPPPAPSSPPEQASESEPE